MRDAGDGIDDHADAGRRRDRRSRPTSCSSATRYARTADRGRRRPHPGAARARRLPRRVRAASTATPASRSGPNCSSVRPSRARRPAAPIPPEYAGADEADYDLLRARPHDDAAPLLDRSGARSPAPASACRAHTSGARAPASASRRARPRDEPAWDYRDARHEAHGHVHGAARAGRAAARARVADSDPADAAPGTIRRALPGRRQPRGAADEAARRRAAHGAAARVPPALAAEGRSARARGGDRGREGARPLLLRVRQPHRGRSSARSAPTLAATTRPICVVEQPVDLALARAHARVPRPLPRARRLAVAARRRRARAPAHRRADPPRRAERRRRRSCSRRTRT